MKRRGRVRAWLLVPIVLIGAVCGVVWGLRPLPPRVKIYTLGGYRTRVEYKREYRVLPSSEWGIRPEGMIACGGNAHMEERTTRLVFFAVTDITSSKRQRVK